VEEEIAIYLISKIHSRSGIILFSLNLMIIEIQTILQYLLIHKKIFPFPQHVQIKLILKKIKTLKNLIEIKNFLLKGQEIGFAIIAKI